MGSGWKFNHADAFGSIS